MKKHLLLIVTTFITISLQSQNVGIGTSSPAQKLDVNGIIAVEGKRAIQGTDSWLRLNQGGDFTTGVYIPSFIRIDGGIASGALTSPGGGAIAASGFINSNTGFRISNAAANGNYLRGNGTNFVSSAIQAADIPTGSGNYIQNQNSVAQTANFRISGNGTLGGTLSVTSTTTTGGISSAAAVGGSNSLSISGGVNQNWFPFTNGANYLSADNTYFRAADNTSTHVIISPKGADVLTVTGGRLRVNNSIMMQDGNQALNRVMRSNANGLASWVDMSTVIPSTDNTNGTVVVGNIRISWGVSGSSLCDNNTRDISLSNFTAVYSAQLTPIGNSDADVAWPMLQVLNTSALRVRAQTTNGSCMDGFHWMVIGLN